MSTPVADGAVAALDSRFDEGTKPASHPRRVLAALALPFVLVVLLLLALATASLLTLSTFRAYVNAESLWSKAQQDAVFHLVNYARSGDREDRARFVASIAVMRGDRTAREEIAKPRYDYAVAEEGFLAGGNHPDDILAAIADDIAADLAAAHPQHPVAWRSANVPRADADPELIAIAIGNLLDNAWKLTSRRRDAKVELDAVQDDGVTWYRVRDNGVGFDPAYVDQIFKPFHRLHDAREFPGTGIGLAIVERVVARHGGQVRAESSPEGGTTFRFTLGPASAPAAQRA